MPLTLPYRKFDGDGNNILFLHGFLGSSLDGRFIHGVFNDCNLWAIDLPGHGQCSKELMNSNFDMSKTAAMIIKTIVDNKMPKMKLYGYSMGGRIALYLALKYPQFFNELILESASPGLQSECEREARRKVDKERVDAIKNNGVKVFIDNWYKMSLFDGLKNDKEVFKNMLLMRYQNNIDGIINSLIGISLAEQPSLWKELPYVNMPTKLIVGEDDLKFVGIAQKMKSINSLFEVIKIKNTGHCIYRQSPNQLRAFLN